MTMIIRNGIVVMCVLVLFTRGDDATNTRKQAKAKHNRLHKTMIIMHVRDNIIMAKNNSSVVISLISGNALFLTESFILFNLKKV